MCTKPPQLPALLNKMRPAFYASVFSLLINWVETLSKYLWIHEALSRKKTKDELK